MQHIIYLKNYLMNYCFQKHTSHIPKMLLLIVGLMSSGCRGGGTPQPGGQGSLHMHAADHPDLEPSTISVEGPCSNGDTPLQISNSPQTLSLKDPSRALLSRKNERKQSYDAPHNTSNSPNYSLWNPSGALLSRQSPAVVEQEQKQEAYLPTKSRLKVLLEQEEETGNVRTDSELANILRGVSRQTVGKYRRKLGYENFYERSKQLGEKCVENSRLGVIAPGRKAHSQTASQSLPRKIRYYTQQPSILKRRCVLKYLKRENTDNPYPDHALSDLILKDCSVEVRRATIGRYRKELGIPNSKERKQLYNQGVKDILQWVYNTQTASRDKLVELLPELDANATDSNQPSPTDGAGASPQSQASSAIPPSPTHTQAALEQPQANFSGEPLCFPMRQNPKPQLTGSCLVRADDAEVKRLLEEDPYTQPHWPGKLPEQRSKRPKLSSAFEPSEMLQEAKELEEVAYQYEFFGLELLDSTLAVYKKLHDIYSEMYKWAIQQKRVEDATKYSAKSHEYYQKAYPLP